MIIKSSFFGIEYKDKLYIISKDSVCHMYESQGEFGLESHLVLKSGKKFTYGMPLDNLMEQLKKII